MHEFIIIRDIVVILFVALPIIFLFKKINLPSIIGFLIAGMILGPFPPPKAYLREKVEI